MLARLWALLPLACDVADAEAVVPQEAAGPVADLVTFAAQHGHWPGGQIEMAGQSQQVLSCSCSCCLDHLELTRNDTSSLAAR